MARGLDFETAQHARLVTVYRRHLPNVQIVRARVENQ